MHGITCTVRSFIAYKRYIWRVRHYTFCLVFRAGWCIFHSDLLNFAEGTEKLEQVLASSADGEVSHVQGASLLGHFKFGWIYLECFCTLLFVHGCVDIDWLFNTGQNFTVHLFEGQLSGPWSWLSVLRIVAAETNEVRVAQIGRFGKDGAYLTEGTEKQAYTLHSVVRLG